MQTTIDKAGRVVIPKELRDAIGLVPGPIDIYVSGNTIQIELPESEVDLVERDGRLLIAGESGMTAEDVRALRMLMQDPARGRGEPDA